MNLEINLLIKSFYLHTTLRFFLHNFKFYHLHLRYIGDFKKKKNCIIFSLTFVYDS